MLSVAGQLGELISLDQLSINQQGVEFMPDGPGNNIPVVALARFDQRGKNLNGAILRGSAELSCHLGQSGGGDRNLALGTVLGAQFGVEEAEEMIDLGDGGHRRFAATTGDTLFDSHSRRKSSDVVDIWLLHLLDELPGIGGHAVEETSLALGEKDIEGEG